MTPSPNYANAGRRVLAAAVVVSMSVPLSISAAMAAPEEQASIAEVTESVQKTDRETSTIDLGASTQDAVTEPQAASAAAVEKAEQSETSETESANPEVQHSSVEAAAENTQVEVAPEGVREEVEQPPQQQAQDQYQNAKSSNHSTRHIDQEKLEQAPVEADSERRFESTEQLDARTQPKAAHEKENDPEDADLNSHEDETEEVQDHSSEGEVEEDDLADVDLNSHDDESVDDKAPSLEDETEEEDYEEESEETPNFSPNGPSLDFRGVRPEADYIIRVGDSERIYTTDPEGSAAIKVLEDFDLSPGAHKVAIVGPDGQEQEITFYATEMQADKTQVNVVGLDPSATYQLSLDGRIAHVGVIDFASMPDGTFTIDINKQFPHAWPGKHVVTLTGGGYNQTAYVRIPLMPTNPDPEPDPDPAPNPQPEPVPDPAPNPQPEPGPEPVPGPHPEPIPNPGLYPSPEPNPSAGENHLPFPKTHPPQPEVDESAVSNDEEEAMPSAIESLNIFHAAEAVEANRPPAYEAAELPLAAGDQANHAAPDALRGTNRHEHRLEAAPMPHAPAPLEQHRNEIQSPRHEPVEQDRFQPDSHNVENTAQGPDSLDTERASMSGLSVAAWIGAALAILAALGVVVFGRKRGTE